MSDDVKSVTVAELVKILASAEIAADAFMVEYPEEDRYRHDRYHRAYANSYLLGSLGLDRDEIAAAVERQRAAGAAPYFPLWRVAG